MDKLKAIIVEDEEPFHLLIETTLQFLDFTNFEFFTRVDHAIDFFEKGFIYDLLILDMGLPDKNGDELLRYISRNKISLPILIYSGRLPEFKRLTFQYITDKTTIKYLQKQAINEPVIELAHAVKELLSDHNCKIRLPELELEIKDNKEQIEYLIKGFDILTQKLK